MKWFFTALVLAWAVAVVIAALNAWLLYQTFVGL